MKGFDAAFDKLLQIEGGYSDDARDRGGKTNWGITEAVARAHGYAGDMRRLPVAEARRIYRAQYWDALRLDEVDALSPAVAEELFDTGVNMGIAVAARFLQQALNVFNRAGEDYADVTADGLTGPKTIEALRTYLHRRKGLGETVLLRALNSLQGARYIDIAEKRQENEAFVFGWFANRVVI